MFGPAVALLLAVVLAQQCTSPVYERCLCSTATPYCPCPALTPTNTLNFASNYSSHLVAVSGQGCRPCAAACLKCSSASVCVQCLGNYQLSGGVCVGCPANCLSCGNGVCLGCVGGYYLDYQANCQSCPVRGSSGCTINSLLACQGGYWLDNNAANCLQCDPHCQQCSSLTRCASCFQGYFLTSAFTCQICLTICASCSDASSCLTCTNLAFFYNLTASACQAGNTPNCTIFFNSTRCAQCDSNFLLASNGSCLEIGNYSIISHCAAHQNVNGSIGCRNCSEGYYNSTGVCLWGCSVLCSACLGPHYGLCFGCVDGAFLSNMHCIPSYHLKGGACYQLFYTPYHNPSFFQPAYIGISSCLPQMIAGGSWVGWQLSGLQSYQITLKWKVYLYNGNHNTSYTIILINSENNITAFLSFNDSYCFPSCSTCPHKAALNFTGKLLDQNKFTLTAAQGNIGISELLVIAYRCGGVQGSSCLECISISQCTRCVNPDFYISGSTCVIACPAASYVRIALRTCLTSCPVQTYPQVQEQTCLQCQYPCLTCLSALQCVSCVQGSYLFEKTCLKKCPDGYYSDTLRRSCVKCLRPCLTCISNIKCSSCLYGFYKQGGFCVLNCGEGYYGNISSLNCESCLSPCATCSSNQGRQCLICLPGYFYFNLNCLLICPDGYFSQNNQTYCQLCSNSCQTCSITSFNCTSCPLSSYLMMDKCLQECPLSTYANSIGNNCTACPSSCSACRSQTICNSCNPNYFFLSANSSCLLSCPDNYYSFSGKCFSCVPPCLTCSSLTQCTSCQSLFLSQSSCIPNCPASTYASPNLKCLPCSSLCLECFGSSTVCTRCNASLILFAGSCLANCPTAYFLSSGDICLKCEQKCLSCLNFSSCLLCNKKYVLQDERCIKQCDSGYYKQIKNLSYSCSKCPQNCGSCALFNGSIICRSCSANYYYIQGKCLSSCPALYFAQNTRCYACLSPCMECLSAINCVSCLPNTGYLLNNSCLIICPMGYFSDILTQACKMCSSSCRQCFQNASNCSSCLFGTYLQNESCVNNCSSGYFASMVKGVCLKCASLCVTCQFTPSFCTSCAAPMLLVDGQCLNNCQEGYYIHNGACIRCGNGCFNCDNATYCRACDIGFYLTSYFNCTSKCGMEYFQLNGRCNRCMYPCGNCTSAQICLTCQSGYFYSGSCVSYCPISTYLNSSLSICEICPSNCSSCLQLDTCLQCSIGVLVNGSCLSQCPNGYYEYYSICAPCMYGCLSCSDSITCNICSSGYLHLGICQQFCPNGWVSTLNNAQPTCEKCIDGCLKCIIQPEECTLCVSGLFLYIFSCINICPLGTFSDLSSSTCVTCKSPCQTCSNGYSCNTCIYGYILYSQQSGNQCIRGPLCPNSYYLQLDSQVCVSKCPLEFYIEPIRRTCSSPCPDSYVLHQLSKTCLQYCPNGQWVNPRFVCVQGYTPALLPRFQCKPLVVRNLLLIDCSFSMQMVNLGNLSPNNFSLDGLTVQSLLIIGKRVVRIVTNVPVGVFRSYLLTVTLSQRYQLFAQTSMQSSYGLQQSQRLLSQRILPAQQIYWLPLQNSNNTLLLNEYFSYSQQQRQTGLQLLQISQSICIGAFIFWFFALLKDMKATSLAFITVLQWIYSLSLLEYSFAPNLNQFLEGFKTANLIFRISTPINNSVWSIGSQYRERLWGVVDLFDFTTIILPSVCVFIIFGLGYCGTYLIGKFAQGSSNDEKQNKDKIEDLGQAQSEKSNKKSSQEKCSEISEAKQRNSFSWDSIKSVKGNSLRSDSTKSQKQRQLQSSTLYKLAYKCRLFNIRYRYNYWYHCILLTTTPISLAISCQIIESNYLSLSWCVLFSIFYAVIVINLIRRSCLPEKLLITSRYWAIIMFQSWLGSGLCVLASAQIYLGLMLLIFLMNIYIWNRLFGSKRSTQLKHFYQINDLLRAIVLLELVVGFTNRKKWDSTVYYYYSWIVIATLLILIVFVAVQSTKQFFDAEEGVKTKDIDTAKEQTDIKHQNSLLQRGKKSSSGQIQEETGSVNEAFFSHRSAADSDSDNDIIDFDQVQSSNAAKELIRYDKQKKDQ